MVLAYIVGVVTAPLVGMVVKPLVRGAVKTTIGAAIQVKKLAEEAGEEFQDLAAEVNTSMKTTKTTVTG